MRGQLSKDEARRIAVNIAKLPDAVAEGPLNLLRIHSDWRRIYHRRPNNLAHLMRAPRTLIRSLKITRPVAGNSDKHHLRAALRTSRNRKGQRDFLYGHLSPSGDHQTVFALAQKSAMALAVDSGGFMLASRA